MNRTDMIEHVDAAISALQTVSADLKAGGPAPDNPPPPPLPSLAFTLSVPSGVAPLIVSAQITATDADTIMVEWGDGAVAHGAVASHTYTAAGVYRVVCTASNVTGEVSEARTLVVSAPVPPPPPDPSVVFADNFTDPFVPFDLDTAARARNIYKQYKSAKWEAFDFNTGGGNPTARIVNLPGGGMRSIMSQMDGVAYATRVWCPDGGKLIFPGIYELTLTHMAHFAEGRGWFDWFILRGGDEDLIRPGWRTTQANPFAHAPSGGAVPEDGVPGVIWTIDRKMHEVTQFDSRSPQVGFWDDVGNFRKHRICPSVNSWRDNHVWQPSDQAYENDYGTWLQGTAADVTNRVLHDFRMLTDGSRFVTFERVTQTDPTQPARPWLKMIDTTLTFPLPAGEWMAMPGHQFYGSIHHLEYLALCDRVHAPHDAAVVAQGRPDLVMRESDWLDRQRYTFELDIRDYRINRLPAMPQIAADPLPTPPVPVPH